MQHIFFQMKKVDTSYIEHEKYKDGTLTIGCIGQPNVGKSSLMNAIIGKKVTTKLAQENWRDKCYDCKHWEDRFHLCIRLAPPLFKHPHIMLQSILSVAWGSDLVLTLLVFCTIPQNTPSSVSKMCLFHNGRQCGLIPDTK